MLGTRGCTALGGVFRALQLQGVGSGALRSVEANADAHPMFKKKQAPNKKVTRTGGVAKV